MLVDQGFALLPDELWNVLPAVAALRQVVVEVLHPDDGYPLRPCPGDECPDCGVDGRPGHGDHTGTVGEHPVGARSGRGDGTPVHRDRATGRQHPGVEPVEAALIGAAAVTRRDDLDIVEREIPSGDQYSGLVVLGRRERARMS